MYLSALWHGESQHLDLRFDTRSMRIAESVRISNSEKSGYKAQLILVCDLRREELFPDTSQPAIDQKGSQVEAADLLVGIRRHLCCT